MVITPGLKRGVLFDLDGTLIDSTSSIQRCWGKVLDELGISREVLDSLHGAPSSQSLRRLLPGADESTVHTWAKKIENYEVTDTEGIVALDGVHETLDFLHLKKIPWIVVTSCTRELGLARSKAVGLELPDNSVFFTDVLRGKPDPEPFMLGAKRLGIATNECIAVEDAPTGIKSAIAAGIQTIALETTFTSEYLGEADTIVANHADLRAYLASIFTA